MATLVTPTKVQKVEYNVTTAEGAARVTTITGTLPTGVSAFSSGPNSTQSVSLKALVDPVLAPGKFRRATASASFGGTFHSAPAVQSFAQWLIDDAQATFDDETGQVQVVVDASVTVSGANANAGINSIIFQITTLAMA